MKGKIVNILFGFVNIFVGLFILLYTIIIPSDFTQLTIQEGDVVKYINVVTLILLFFVFLIDILQSYVHRNDSFFNIAYLIGAFSISFLFLKINLICVFGILSGLIILYKSLKENMVELNSLVMISISAIMIILIILLSVFTYNYASLGSYIKNQNNKDQLAYEKDFFKYITELDDTDKPYINVKINGKYGYIDVDKNEIIPFKYDFATPFVEITSFDKRFQIALVCIDGETQIIMKNQRKVMTYKTESRNENYEAKYEELKNIYTNVLEQSGEMHYEIEKIVDNINKVPAYDIQDPEYTYKYDYNDEYDILITETKIGNTYEFAQKANINLRLEIDAKNLDYDKDYLYLYSNGTIPFFDNIDDTSDEQGWFTSYRAKKTLKGNAQVLDFYDDKVLLKNYNNGLYYFIDSNDNDVKPVSENYKDIFVCPDGNYIVKTESNTFKVINKDFENIFSTEYKVINPRLISKDLYIVTDDVDNVEFNDYNFAKMNWKILNKEGNVILENIEQIYDIYFKLPDKEDNKNEENYMDFQENLMSLEYHFVGEKFYKNKNKAR